MKYISVNDLEQYAKNKTHKPEILEIIRCSDCGYYSRKRNKCGCHVLLVSPDDFCSRGYKRDSQ